MLGFVHGRIIDGERWIAERLAFLTGRLAAELTVEERSAVQAEVEILAKERGISLGGLRAGCIRRRVRRRTERPAHRPREGSAAMRRTAATP